MVRWFSTHIGADGPGSDEDGGGLVLIILLLLCAAAMFIGVMLW